MAHNHSGIGELWALNPRLISQQHLTEAEIEIVTELHQELDRAFDQMEKVDIEDIGGRKHLRNLAIIVQEIEFRLQESWGFERNENCHSWWFQVPHCKCPTLDNWDHWGTPYAVRRLDCPIHGEENE